MINPTKGWFFWGIGPKKQFGYHSYDDASVRGIGANIGFRPHADSRHNDSDLNPSTFGNCEVDILLDLDSKEMRMCIVGKKDSNENCTQEAIWHDMDVSNGWIPHFNFGYSQIRDQKIQIVQVPFNWYGQAAMIEWDEDAK